MPNTAPLQIVHLDDLLATVMFFLGAAAPSKVAVDVAGPERYRFDEVVAMHRKWMRWPSARVLRIPDAVAGLIYRLGDLAGLFGWRSPVRSTARLEMVRGAMGDPSPLTQLTGITPHNVEHLLNREPASVQERWFARLYLLKPLIFGVFALFWIVTGLISVGPGRERGIELVMEGGTSETVALLATLSGGLADIVIGIAIAFRRTARLGLLAALGISVVYLILGTILVPICGSIHSAPCSKSRRLWSSIWWHSRLWTTDDLLHPQVPAHRRRVRPARDGSRHRVFHAAGASHRSRSRYRRGRPNRGHC
jgi:hypothetical protein